VNHRRAALAERLHGVTVGDVMRRESFAVDARTNLEELAGQYLLPGGGDCFVVWEGGSLAGRVGVEDVAEVPRRRWPYTTADEVMQPVARMQSISAAAAASESLEIMGRHGIAELPVLEGGRLLGVVSRGRILRLLRERPPMLRPAAVSAGAAGFAAPPRLLGSVVRMFRGGASWH
jgi:CBS domain-containing protein